MLAKGSDSAALGCGGHASVPTPQCVTDLHDCLSCFFLSGAKSNWGLKVRRARIRIRKMCKTQWWFWTVLTMVAMNTVSVMVEHYNQPQWLTDALCKLR